MNDRHAAIVELTVARLKKLDTAEALRAYYSHYYDWSLWTVETRRAQWKDG